MQGKTKLKSLLNLHDYCAENEALNSSSKSTTSDDSVEIKLAEIGEPSFLYRTSQVLNDVIRGSKQQIKERSTNLDSLANVEFESLVSCIKPALWNHVFFMTGDEEEKVFESHNFTWQKRFLGTCQSENVTSRKRCLSRLRTCFQLFHAQDKNFLYLFQMYNSDIINQYGSDVLMEHVNSWGISDNVNPETFRLFRSEVAQNQKHELLKGEIHNLEIEVFGDAHIDDKEFSRKYKRQGDRIVHCTGI